MGPGIAHSILNPQQSEAITCRATSVVLSSGAGCGKTRVLTERYLSHLENDEAEVGQIVAITFTDRAARQMRERIRQALMKKLKEALGDEDAERWARHLRALETAPISTIHAFCVTLLRQHAVEAGLDPHFNVLEDVLSTNLKGEALTDCLQDLLVAKTMPGEDLRELILLFGWKPVGAAIQHVLQDEDARAWQDWLQRPAEQIAAGWHTYAHEELLQRYVPHLMQASPKIARCLELLKRKGPLPGTKMAENARSLLDKMSELPEADDLAAAVEELTELAKVGGERERAWPSKDHYEAAKEAFEGFRKDLPAKMQVFLRAGDDLAAAALVGQRFIRVATEAAAAYQALKRHNGVLDFQDLLVLTRNLVRDRQSVRERLQRRYRILLIDELQDTDPVQMELIEHLCGAELVQGKLFAVGDHKQSIYRFRGADVHRFQQLRRQVPHEGRLELTVNYRSQPAILHFTNALLSRHLEDYEPLEPHHPQVNPDPCIEFLWSPREAKDLASDAREREAGWIADRIAAMVRGGEMLVVDREGGGSKLRNCLEKGSGPLEFKGPDPFSKQFLRPVSQGDITILFRSMSNVHLYEAALRRHGLDYYLVGGRAFFAQQEIYDLLNLLRALENPEDSLSLAGTLRSPFCCLSDESLLLLARHPQGLWRGLHDTELLLRLPEDQRQTADRARHYLDRWHGLKDRLPIARLLGEVFADSGYDASTQFEFLGDRKLANLWKLVDLARTFDRTGLFGLAEFIQRLGDLVRNQPREEQAATLPESADVIRLMTIHQAKGLEFPVVIVPDLAAAVGGPHFPSAHWDARLGCVCRPPPEDPPPFTDFGWRLWEASEEMEEAHEDLRTLYVACTRAEDYLILSASLPASFSPSNAWMLTLFDRFDLRTGRCRDETILPEQQPSVRVIDRPIPSPRKRKATRPERSEPVVLKGEIPSRVAPVPPRLTGQELIAVDQLERFLHGRPQADLLGTVVLRPDQVASQFDAEDGSDRNAWVDPRARIQPEAPSEPGLRDRIIRTVLDGWDFREPDGWRAVLHQALASGEAASQPDVPGELERLFRQFSDSETYQQLAAAKCSWSDLEYVLAVGGTSKGGGVRGVVDCLWQDANEDWHLLFYTTRSVPPEKQAVYRESREPAMALAARAVQQRFDCWPKTVTIYLFEEGKTIEWTGRVLGQKKRQAAVEAALSDFLAQPLLSC